MATSPLHKQGHRDGRATFPFFLQGDGSKIGNILHLAIKMFHNNTYASGTAFRREASVSHLKRKWRFWVIDQSKRMSWVIDVALFCKHSAAFQNVCKH